MKLQWNEKEKSQYFQWGVTVFLVVACSMLFYYGIFHTKTLFSGIQKLLNILAPIIYGLAIAYLLSFVVNFFEKKLIYPLLRKKNVTLSRGGRRAVRWIVAILSLFLFLVIIFTLIMMILPQLIRSVTNIIYSFPEYVNSMENLLDSALKNQELSDATISTVESFAERIQTFLTTDILPQMQTMMKNISEGIFDVLIFLKNFIIGAVVSIYVLADKEIFVAKSKMVVYAVLPVKLANTVVQGMRFTHKTFGGFFTGKIIDSMIIGVLCYVGTSIIGTPYNTLVSVIIGVTNVIPFFGPYLGAIPCILLILLVDPLQALYLAIFILALQQFDGNILGPKILGDSTGLSSFMVILAIMVGGGLFGVVGMIVGVPVTAVIYTAFWKLIERFLHRKKIPEDTKEYINAFSMDEETGQLNPMPPAQKRRPSPVKKREGILILILRELWKIIVCLLKFVREFLLTLWMKCREKFRKRGGRGNS